MPREITSQVKPLCLAEAPRRRRGSRPRTVGPGALERTASTGREACGLLACMASPDEGRVDWAAMEQQYAEQARYWRTAEQSWRIGASRCCAASSASTPVDSEVSTSSSSTHTATVGDARQRQELVSVLASDLLPSLDHGTQTTQAASSSPATVVAEAGAAAACAAEASAFEADRCLSRRLAAPSLGEASSSASCLGEPDLTRLDHGAQMSRPHSPRRRRSLHWFGHQPQADDDEQLPTWYELSAVDWSDGVT